MINNTRNLIQNNPPIENGNNQRVQNNQGSNPFLNQVTVNQVKHVPNTTFFAPNTNGQVDQVLNQRGYNEFVQIQSLDYTYDFSEYNSR
jgi:hypothetical protein